MVDGLITQKNGNPCTQGNIFGCSPPPIIFNRYKNNRNGITLVNLTFSPLVPSADECFGFTHSYKCRRDPNSGKCGNDVISVCVSTHLALSMLLGLSDMLLLVPQRWKLDSDIIKNALKELELNQTLVFSLPQIFIS